MDWTDAVILSLRVLWDEGLSTAEIGRRLGITKNAVVGKAHRLVLPARPSPIRRGVTGMAAPRRSTGPTLPSMELPGDAPLPAGEWSVGQEAAPAVVQVTGEAVVRVPERTAPAPSQGPVAPVTAARPVAATADVADRDEPEVAAQAPRPVSRAAAALRPVAPRRMRVVACCWPIGEPGTRSFRFCDAESMAGKPYCDTHAQLAYVKVRERRDDAA